MQDKLENINEQWEEIEKNLTALESKVPELEPHLHSFGKGLNAIAMTFQRVHENVEKRQFLIDFQCNQKVFAGSVHEEYHAVSAQLDVEFDIYISSIKTALNRLPVLIYNLLKHADCRGLKIKSFGSFIGSIANKTFEQNSAKNIQSLLVNQGKEIDETINSYRDKNIEHIQSPSNRYGLATDKTGVRKHHQKIDISKKPHEESLAKFKKRIETLPQERRSSVMRVKLENGEYIYYVHIENDKKTGEHLKKGDLLGHTSDGGSGHFDKYGPHVHTFTSPNLPLEEINQQEGYFSPSAFASLITITDFLDSIIKSLVEIVEAGY